MSLDSSSRLVVSSSVVQFFKFSLLLSPEGLILRKLSFPLRHLALFYSDLQHPRIVSTLYTCLLTDSLCHAAHLNSTCGLSISGDWTFPSRRTPYLFGSQTLKSFDPPISSGSSRHLFPFNEHHGNIFFFTQLSRFPYRLLGQPPFAGVFFLLIHTTAAVFFFHRNQSTSGVFFFHRNQSLPASPNNNFFFTWIFVSGLAGNSRRSSMISGLFAKNHLRLSSSLTDWKGSNNLCFNLNQSLNASCSSFDRDQSNVVPSNLITATITLSESIGVLPPSTILFITGRFIAILSLTVDFSFTMNINNLGRHSEKTHDVGNNFIKQSYQLNRRSYSTPRGAASAGLPGLTIGEHTGGMWKSRAGKDKTPNHQDV
uniref:Uncharacterized protein n=1 Tax=Cucumis melo TaxID=3656 RepID=A0A9I9EG31_CUCME